MAIIKEEVKYRVSRREFQVIQQLVLGKTNIEIAQSLGISETTVKFHLANLYRKFEVGNRAGLIVKCT